MCVLCLNLEVVRRARNSTRGAAQPCCSEEEVGRCKEGTELGLLGQVANWSQARRSPAGTAAMEGGWNS